MAIDAQDKKFLVEAEKALAAAWDRYHAADEADRLELYPQVELAYRNWIEIRIRLMEPGTLSSAADVAEARALGTAIRNAANHQKLVLALVRFVALLGKFA